jgi:putative autotransporter adhesin-like protein
MVAAILIALLVDRIFFNSSPAGTGSGVAATQARSLPQFTGVDLAGDNNIIVHVGARQSVIIHADTNLLRRVTTQVRSGRLVIGTTPGNLNARAPMVVTVSVPSLDALTLHGAGNITATGINSRNLTVLLPGSGNIHVTGTATRLDVTMSGEGTALLRQLIARDVNAALRGDGAIMLTATHRLNASVSGSGTILYGGNPPHVTTKVSSNGTITPG